MGFQIILFVPLQVFFFLLMEGNKFHTPETPPAIDLGQYVNHTSDASVSDLSEKTLSGAIHPGDPSSSSPPPLRRTSHTDQALHLVDTVTRTRERRRPSRGGILSNLLKLDLFEEKQRRQKIQGTKSPQGTKTPPPQPTKPQRPPLKSITSSRALLQTINASPATAARNSMYFEDLHKAELGRANHENDVEMAAHRLAIASEIADILQRQDLIIKMGKCLVRTGAPSHRIVSQLYILFNL